MVEIPVWERGDVGLTQLQERLKSSVRFALCDVLMEYYLLIASLSYIPDHYLKPSCKNARLKKLSSHKSLTVITTHRRTPSAGSLGCGRTHSPKPQPRGVRSQSASPVWHKASTSGISKINSPEILTTPPSLDPKLSKDAENISAATDGAESRTGEPAKSKQSLLSPPNKQCKPRSHSEGGGQSTAHFIPIGRSLSTPTPPVVESGNRDKSKGGRFSPYETFTENELTESREFGEEAVKVNSRYASRISSNSSRRTSGDGEGGTEMKERHGREDTRERRKYENGEKGELHSR